MCIRDSFMGDNFQKSSYEGARKMIQDPDSKWMSYVNRALDEIDPHVIKQTALNLEMCIRDRKDTDRIFNFG